MKNRILICVYKDGMEIKSWNANGHLETQIVVYDKQFKKIALKKALHLQDSHYDKDIIVVNHLKKSYYDGLNLQC